MQLPLVYFAFLVQSSINKYTALEYISIVMMVVDERLYVLTDVCVDSSALMPVEKGPKRKGRYDR